MKKLVWHTEKRLVKDLIKYPKNPRKISETEKSNIRISLQKFGLVEIPVIDTDNVLVAGHQRMELLLLTGMGETEVDVRVPNRKLTEDEFKRYNIISNRQAGKFDPDKLAASFDYTELVDWGFNATELPKSMAYNKEDLYEGKTVGKEKLGFALRLEFQTKKQQEDFDSYIKKLKALYPDKLISQSLIAFINDKGI